MKKRLTALALATVASPLAGCAVVQEKTIGEAFDENSASSQIKTKLLSAGAKKFAEVDVEVTGRLALLSGRVNTPEDRIEAERIAWEVKILDEVANELEIKDTSGVASNISDELITGQVRARMFANKQIKSVNFNIETHNGTVFLLGLARNDAELRAAAEAASRVRGVKKVVSYVKLRKRNPVREDTSVAQAGNSEGLNVQMPSAPGQGTAYDARPNYEQSYNSQTPVQPLPPNYQPTPAPPVRSQPHIDPDQASGYTDPYGDDYVDDGAGSFDWDEEYSKLISD